MAACGPVSLLGVAVCSPMGLGAPEACEHGSPQRPPHSLLPGTRNLPGSSSPVPPHPSSFNLYLLPWGGLCCPSPQMYLSFMSFSWHPCHPPGFVPILSSVPPPKGPKVRNKTRVPTLTTTIQHSFGCFGHSNQQKKKFRHKSQQDPL